MVRSFIDPRDYPSDKPALDLDGIHQLIPHRHEFTQVHSILNWNDEEKSCVGFRKGEEDEFWVRGHIPGRPMLPGVLLLEALAQVGIIQIHARCGMSDYHPWIGFAGAEGVRFRGVVHPGEDLWLPGHLIKLDVSRGYVKWTGQALRSNGEMVANATIVGKSF